MEASKFELSHIFRWWYVRKGIYILQITLVMGFRYALMDLDGQLFESTLISAFDHDFINEKRPMVLFATPGMLNGGLSLSVCKAWAPDPHNLIIIPGYCIQGTVGNRLIMGIMMHLHR